MYVQPAGIFMILLRVILRAVFNPAQLLKHCLMTGFVLPAALRNQCSNRRARHIKSMGFDKKYAVMEGL